MIGFSIKEKTEKALHKMEEPEFVVVNDNSSESLGGEYVEYDAEKCRELAEKMAEVLDGAKYKGVKENFLGGFGIIFRAGDGENEVTLWIYEDRIEIAKGNYVSISILSDSSIYDALKSLTE